MVKINSLVLFGIIFLALFGSISDVVYYPDGPFSVVLTYERQPITLKSDFVLHTDTKITEHKSGSTYSKSSGTSAYYNFYAMTLSANDQLDSWFTQGSVAPLKDLYLSIRNGKGQTIEAWQIYRVSPSGRLVLNDGSVKYTFKTSSFERDVYIRAPARTS